MAHRSTMKIRVALRWEDSPHHGRLTHLTSLIGVGSGWATRGDGMLSRGKWDVEASR